MQTVECTTQDLLDNAKYWYDGYMRFTAAAEAMIGADRTPTMQSDDYHRVAGEYLDMHHHVVELIMQRQEKGE